MKFYFRDHKRNLRGVEASWQIAVLEDQTSLKAVIKTGSDITPCSAVLGVIK